MIYEKLITGRYARGPSATGLASNFDATNEELLYVLWTMTRGDFARRHLSIPTARAFATSFARQEDGGE